MNRMGAKGAAAFDGAGRVVYTSAGRRLLAAMLAARDETGFRVWTLERLSRETRASVNAIHSLANGLSREPSLRTLAALHDLGIDWRSWLQD
jgi:transcriptional regulator with XRE-family HTH domain